MQCKLPRRPSSTVGRCHPARDRAPAPLTTGEAAQAQQDAHRRRDARPPAGAHRHAADEQDRAQVAELAEAVQQVTGESVELAYVDQGYTGEAAANP